MGLVLVLNLSIKMVFKLKVIAQLFAEEITSLYRLFTLRFIHCTFN